MAKTLGTRGWTPEEDKMVLAAERTGVDRGAVAKLLGRTRSAIGHRVGLLRQSGDLPAVRASAQRGSTRAGAYENLGPAPAKVGAPLTLDRDAELVRNCLAEGGFPRPFVLEGRTFWITPEGHPWRHTPPAVLKRAA